MAHFAIYIPGAKGCSPEPLHSAGLGELLRADDPGPDATFCQMGPDGNTGVFYTWNLTGGDRSGLDRIVWKKNHSGSWWVGTEPDRPVQPKDIARRFQINGAHITFADGFNWILPTISRFPATYGMDESGELVRAVRDQYKSLHDAAVRVVSDVLSEFGAIEMIRERKPELSEHSIKITVDQGLRLIASALAINYRITFEIMLMLGLVDDSTASRAICELCELRELKQSVDQKKNLEPISVRVSSYS